MSKNIQLKQRENKIIVNNVATIASRYTKIGVLLVGAGRGGSKLLEMFHGYRWVDVEGVVEKDPDAIGCKTAEGYGIPVYPSIDIAIRQFRGEMIVDATGSPKAFEQLMQIKHRETEIIAGRGAKLLFDLVSELQEQQKKMKTQVELQEKLLDISIQLGRRENREHLYDVLLSGALSLTPSKIGCFYLMVDGQLMPASYRGFTRKLPEAPDKKTMKTLEKIILKDKTVNVLDCQKHPELRALFDIKDVSSIISVPLFDNNRWIGLILMVSDEDVTLGQMNLMGQLSIESALAIRELESYEKIKSLSEKDELTGLYNRRYFNKIIEHEIKMVTNHGKGNLGMLMIDIDFFKKINDKFGHTLGDKVLKQVSKTIQRCLRNNDTAARYGGEEFAVLIPIDNNTNIMEIAERLRFEIEAIKYNELQGLKSTVSIGAGVYHINMKNSEELVKLADQAVYEAKHNGRNQVILREAGLCSSKN